MHTKVDGVLYEGQQSFNHVHAFALEYIEAQRVNQRAHESRAEEVARLKAEAEQVAWKHAAHTAATAAAEQHAKANAPAPVRPTSTRIVPPEEHGRHDEL
jgi:hypothetical protein